MPLSHCTRRRSGFSLIELLVAIGVIAILIGILLPALSGAKIRSSQVKALSDLRQIGISIQLYIEDSGGVYPYAPPNTPHLVGPPDGLHSIIYVGNDDPWSMSYLWVTAMHRVAPWREHYSTWIGVGREHGDRAWTSGDDENLWLIPAYWMSHAFVASPGTWSDSGVARIQPIRPGQVRYPSAKVMFFDAMRPYVPLQERDERSRGVLFADGSSRDVMDDDAAIPVMNRITEFEPKTYHDTPMGVEGRDF